MRKILPALCLIFIISLSFIFVGCGQTKLETPPSNAVIYANGGNMVCKGDFVYFINGYESYSSLDTTNKNKQGLVKVSAIYKGKMVNGSLSNVEILVSKVAGYEYGSLYIFGDTLYFASPNTNKDKSGNVRYDLITFFKINLDGTGLKEIYTTESYSSGKYTMLTVENTPYLLIYDGAKILRINLNNHQSVTLVDNATSVVFPIDKSTLNPQEQALYVSSEHNNFVYYTRPRPESNSGFSGNILEKKSITNTSADAIQLHSDLTLTMTLTDLTGDIIYYKKDTNYFSLNLENNTEFQQSYISLTGFNPLSKDIYGNYKGIIIQYNSKTYFKNVNTINIESEPLIDESITILFEKDNYVYFLSSTNEIKRVNLLNRDIDLIAQNIGEINTSTYSLASFDGRYIYFLSKESASTNTYLYMSDTTNLNSDDNNMIVCGVMLKTDIDLIETAREEEFED